MGNTQRRMPRDRGYRFLCQTATNMAQTVSTLIAFVDNKTLLLPEFQRGYVWNRNPDGEHVRVAALWDSVEAHNRALHEEKTHPAFKVFEAAGLDPQHSVMDVMGHLG